MLNWLSFAVFLVTFGQLSVAQVPFPGSCPDVNPMSEFDLDAYTGTWYEHSKYPFIFEFGQKCIYAVYGNLGNDTVSVLNTGINRFTNNPSSVEGYAKVLGPARLAVVFGPGQSETEPNYIVLGTDYKNYAVVYSCKNFAGIINTRVVWILTRERKPSAEIVAAAKAIIDKNKLSQRFLIETDQDDCPNVDVMNDGVNLFDVSDDFNDVISVR